MINGLGIVGWGVGGIEAEAGMLGQPVYFLTPDVVGVHLTGALREGVTATDLALTVTQLLRKAKVVGKFVEFYGPGAAALPVVDRATIANMAPEYGATMGFFPIDAECIELPAGHRPERGARRPLRGLLQGAGPLGHPGEGRRSTTRRTSSWTWARWCPSVAGPKRPQDRIELPRMKQEFVGSFSRPVAENGFGKKAEDLGSAPADVAMNGQRHARRSATAASSSPRSRAAPTPPIPRVMLAAGLLAKKAVERGLTVGPRGQVVARARARGS